MSEELPILVVGRRRGRPRLSAAEGSADVHLTLPEGMYDKAYSVASRERISVPEVIRRALSRALRAEFRNPK
jgi:hypothetical protein